MQSRFLSHIHSAHYMPESRYTSNRGIEYSIAFYPLALIIVAYRLIELHAHNFRVIVWIWRPFHRCFARFRQQWNIRTSIVDAFATFLLLSNNKLLNVSFDLLTPTLVYNVNETVVGIYLYYDASIEYFGTKKHLPYAILTVFVVITLSSFLYCFCCCIQCSAFSGVLVTVE